MLFKDPKMVMIGTRLPMAVRQGYGMLWRLHPRMQSSAESVKDHVLDIEVAGEAYYRKLAKESPAPLDDIFNRLADEEHQHHDTLERAFADGDIPGLRV